MSKPVWTFVSSVGREPVYLAGTDAVLNLARTGSAGPPAVDPLDSIRADALRRVDTHPKVLKLRKLLDGYPEQQRRRERLARQLHAVDARLHAAELDEVTTPETESLQGERLSIAQGLAQLDQDVSSVRGICEQAAEQIRAIHIEAADRAVRDRVAVAAAERAEALARLERAISGPLEALQAADTRMQRLHDVLMDLGTLVVGAAKPIHLPGEDPEPVETPSMYVGSADQPFVLGERAVVLMA